MEKDVIHAGFDNLVYKFLGQDRTSLDTDFGSLDVHNLSGVLIHEVFVPCLENPGCKSLSDMLFKLFSICPYLLGQIEDVENVLI